MTTVPMQFPETGKTADVHPLEVENWKKGGWRVIDAPKQPKSVMPPPSVSSMPPTVPDNELSESDMRKAIFEATGERPGPNTRRETLVEKYRHIAG